MGEQAALRLTNGAQYCALAQPAGHDPLRNRAMSSPALSEPTMEPPIPFSRARKFALESVVVCYTNSQQVLRLVNLEILDLSRNEIPIIPEEIKQMTSLKFLAIARNHIKRLPLSLGDMTSLSKLKFDDNPIEFPPPDVYKGLYPDDESGKKVNPEKEKEICQKVKRFLKTASMRERVLRTNPRDDGR